MFRNPGTFYMLGENNDWTTPQNADLWRDGLKTLFDPCPSGWRVPRSGEEDSGRNPWATFTVTNGVQHGTDAANPSSGRRWRSPLVFGGEAWYPLIERRYFVTGEFQQGAGYCHTSTIHTLKNISAGHFVYDLEKVLNFDPHSRAHAHPVRCVRE